MERSFDATVFTKNRPRLMDLRRGPGPVRRGGVGGRWGGAAVGRVLGVDGTLIEAAASPGALSAQGRAVTARHGRRSGNPSVDFRRERRSNETHASTTDPEAHLLHKGDGKEAKLDFLGHALMGAQGYLNVRLPPRAPWGTTKLHPHQ